MKAKKAAEREERRVARNQRKELREAGLLDEPEVAAPIDWDEILGPVDVPAAEPPKEP